MLVGYKERCVTSPLVLLSPLRPRCYVFCLLLLFISKYGSSFLPLHCVGFLVIPGSVLTGLTLGLVFCGTRVRAGLGSGFRAAFALIGFGVVACFRPAAFCSVDGAF